MQGLGKPLKKSLILDKNTPFPERILTLIREHIVTIISTLTALLAGIATTVLSVMGDFGGGGGTGDSLPKDQATLEKWLDRLTDAVKRLAGNVVEALPAIMGSVIAAILSFLGKAVGFVAEHI